MGLVMRGDLIRLVDCGDDCSNDCKEPWIGGVDGKTALRLDQRVAYSASFWVLHARAVTAWTRHQNCLLVIAMVPPICT